VSPQTSQTSWWCRWKRTLLGIALVVGVWWVLSLDQVRALVLASTPPPLSMPMVGAAPLPPDIDVTTLTGQRVALAEDRRPLVLNLFATWCPPCVAEIPSLLRLREAVAPDIKVLIASNESVDTLWKWTSQNAYDPAAFGHINPTAIQGALATDSIPVTWIVDSRGHIVDRVLGAHAWDRDSVVHAVRSLLKP